MPPRRTFLERFTLGSLGGLATAYLAGILAYLAPARRSDKATAGLTMVGSLEDWPVGTAKVTQHGDRAVLVIRNETETVGFSAACTHLGCIVHYDPERKQIMCPCHAAIFDLQGSVVSGPPPRPLPPVPVEVRDGRVYLGGQA